MSIAGLVLAAGAGTRFGGPKVLARDGDGTAWLERAVELLRAAGCAPVLVAIGAERDEALRLIAGLPHPVLPVVVERWADGVSTSISTGLQTLADRGADGRAADAGGNDDIEALVIVPVDVPSLSTAMVERLIGIDAGEGGLAGALRQAVFGSRPGHPALIGRDHWELLRASLEGDVGARPYLVANRVLEVDCADLGSGEDVDSRAPRAP